MKKWKQHQGFLQLVGLIIIVPLVAWVFGFRQTVKLWRACNARQEMVSRLAESRSGVGNELPGSVSGKQILNNGVLLGQLERPIRDNGVKMVKYTPYLTREEGKIQVHTGELVLSGGFTSLLKVMHYMEKEGHPGKIVSAGFRLFDDRAKKERQLRMTLVVQQLTMEN